MITPTLAAKLPPPGCSAPRNLAFSPDDKILSYLLADPGSLTKRLMGIDVEGEVKHDTIEVNRTHMAETSPAAAAVTSKCLFFLHNEKDEDDNTVFSSKEQIEQQCQHRICRGVTSYSWCSSPLMRCNGTLSSSTPLPPTRLFVPLHGDIYVQDGWDRSTTRLVYQKNREESVALSAQPSPDGLMVAFIMRDEIFVSAVNPAQETEGSLLPSPCKQLTYGACDGVTNGVADFIAQEEMDRDVGFWWSPDSRSIVFTHVDERSIPQFHIPKYSASKTKSLRYPFAGKENCITELGVISVDAERVKGANDQFNHAEYNPVWLDISTSFNDGDHGAAYVARIGWLPDGSVYAQVQNRAQTKLQVLRLDIETGHQTLLLEETSTVWVNLHDMMWCIPGLGSLCQSVERSTSKTMLNKNGDGLYSGQEDSSSSSSKGANNTHLFHFLWGSERSDFMQLYLYEFNPDRSIENNECAATLVHSAPLGGGTKTKWVVDSIVRVDTAKGIVYVLGTLDSPCERHLYKMSLLDTSQPVKRLTQGVGMHTVVMNHSCTVFVDVFSSLERPPTTSISVLPEVDGVFLQISVFDMHDALDDQTKTLGLNLQPPEICCIKARDQVTDLFVALYRPDLRKYGEGPYPTVVSVYGGPTTQEVSRGWDMTADMRIQLLRGLGFLVVKCDNRGSNRRGVKFSSWIKHRVGFVEVEDQEDVVKYLVQKRLANLKYVGVYGWSYGGFIAAMCMLRAPETFAVGICGAPVTSWDAYATHYTERIMGCPDENRDGYRDSSLLSHVSKLQGKLLLIHGLIDENVHFDHTVRLISALMKERKQYDLKVIPNAGHWVSEPQSRIYMEQRITNYLVQYLNPSPLHTAASAISVGSLSSNTISPPLNADLTGTGVVSAPPSSRL